MTISLALFVAILTAITFGALEAFERKTRRRKADPRRSYRDALRGAALRLDVAAGALRLANEIVAGEARVSDQLREGQFARMAEDAAAAAAVCRQIAVE